MNTQDASNITAVAHHSHQTAPTQYVEADANHGSLYQYPERLVTHVTQFLSGTDEPA